MGSPVPMPGATRAAWRSLPETSSSPTRTARSSSRRRSSSEVLERAEAIGAKEKEIRAELAAGLSLAEALAKFGHV